ncbi:MAG: DedA family protein [Holosporales bacterium]|jgi:membrane protein DedA with SNARE-associated domain|nr:DedA family protein [Holosporales bacterium]
MFTSGAVADFIKEWGYVAVFMGSIIEGEVILLTASAFAAFGHLSIYKIFFVAFITTVITDQILFLIGYKVGISWIVNKYPKLERAKIRVFSLLNRMDILFIFAFRFIYGIRTISPLIIGTAQICPSRFVVFNVLSGLCWAFVCCFFGYTIADVIMDGNFDTTSVVMVLSVTVIVGLLFSFLISMINKKKNI